METITPRTDSHFRDIYHPTQKTVNFCASLELALDQKICQIDYEQSKVAKLVKALEDLVEGAMTVEEVGHTEYVRLDQLCESAREALNEAKL